MDSKSSPNKNQQKQQLICFGGGFTDCRYFFCLNFSADPRGQNAEAKAGTRSVSRETDQPNPAAPTLLCANESGE